MDGFDSSQCICRYCIEAPSIEISKTFGRIVWGGSASIRKWQKLI